MTRRTLALLLAAVAFGTGLGWVISNWSYVHMGSGAYELGRLRALTQFRARLEGCLRVLSVQRDALALQHEHGTPGGFGRHWQRVLRSQWVKYDNAAVEETAYVEAEPDGQFGRVLGYQSRSDAPAPSQIAISPELWDAVKAAHKSHGPRFFGPATAYAGSAHERGNLLRVVLSVVPREAGDPASKNYPSTFLLATLDFSARQGLQSRKDEGLLPPVALGIHLGPEAEPSTLVGAMPGIRSAAHDVMYEDAAEPEPFKQWTTPTIHGSTFTLQSFRHPFKGGPKLFGLAAAALGLIGAAGLCWQALRGGVPAIGRLSRAVASPMGLGLAVFAFGFAMTAAVGAKTRANAVKADAQRFATRTSDLASLLEERMLKCEEVLNGMSEALKDVNFSMSAQERRLWEGEVESIGLGARQKGLLEVGLAEITERGGGDEILRADPRYSHRAADACGLEAAAGSFESWEAAAMSGANMAGGAIATLPFDYRPCENAPAVRAIRVFAALRPLKLHRESTGALRANHGLAYAVVSLNDALSRTSDSQSDSEISAAMYPSQHFGKARHLAAAVGVPPAGDSHIPWAERLLSKHAKRHTQNFFGMDWTLQFEANSAFYKISTQGFEWVVLLGGALLSSLAGIGLHHLHRGRLHAETLLRSLRQSEAGLRAALDRRQRLEMKIHDHPLQELHVAQMSLRRAVGQLDRLASECAATTAPAPSALRAKSLVEEGICSLREAGLTLRRVVWEGGDQPGQSLSAELHSFRDKLATRTGVAVQFSIAPAIDLLDAEKVEHLRSIIQESCYNALKHGHPGNLSLTLEAEGTWVRLRVEDDGVGFDAATGRQGHGLANIRRRAEALGGRVEWTSTPGAATTIDLTFPFNNEAPPWKNQSESSLLTTTTPP